MPVKVVIAIEIDETGRGEGEKEREYSQAVSTAKESCILSVQGGKLI